VVVRHSKDIDMGHQCHLIIVEGRGVGISAIYPPFKTENGWARVARMVVRELEEPRSWIRGARP
jgi:hypothetical protein